MATCYDLAKDVPSTFMPDTDNLDTKESYNMQFPRTVANTQWAKDKDIQGKDVRTVRLVDVCVTKDWTISE